MKVILEDIQAAQQTIQYFINLTPYDYSRSCSQLMGADIFLKLEHNQRIGSFKIREALKKWGAKVQQNRGGFEL